MIFHFIITHLKRSTNNELIVFIYQEEMSNIHWFQALKYEDLLVCLYRCEYKIFGFWTVGLRNVDN